MMGGMGDLLEEDLRVLDWVTRFVGALGYPPTVRELMRAFDLASTADGYDVLHRLEAFGFLDVDPGVQRGIRLTGLPSTDDLAANRIRLWLVEAAALIRRLAQEEDKEAEAFLRRISSVTF